MVVSWWIVAFLPSEASNEIIFNIVIDSIDCIPNIVDYRLYFCPGVSA